MTEASNLNSELAFIKDTLTRSRLLRMLAWVLWWIPAQTIYHLYHKEGYHGLWLHPAVSCCIVQAVEFDCFCKRRMLLIIKTSALVRKLRWSAIPLQASHSTDMYFSPSSQGLVAPFWLAYSFTFQRLSLLIYMISITIHIPCWFKKQKQNCNLIHFHLDVLCWSSYIYQCQAAPDLQTWPIISLHLDTPGSPPFFFHCS